MSVGYDTGSSSPSSGSDPEVDGYNLEWGKHAPYPQWTVTHKGGRTFEITWDHSEDCPGCIVQIVAGTSPNGGIYNCVTSGGGKCSGTFQKKEGKPLFFDGALEYTCADAKDKFKNTDWVGKITKKAGGGGGGGGGKPKPGILDWIKDHKLLIGGGVGGVIMVIVLLKVLTG